jgi:Na+/H+ antiporter NhaD/arsenite permease-like protein
MAAKIGSAATIAGNPAEHDDRQLSGIPCRYFLAMLAPVAILGVVLAAIVMFVAYRRELQTPEGVGVAEMDGRVDR